MNSKTCTECGAEKPLSDFYRSSYARDGLKPQCADCCRNRVRDSYRAKRSAPITLSCTRCGADFVDPPRSGPPRMYCSEKCRYEAGNIQKRAHSASSERRCACGALVTTRVGKAVCLACRKDPRPDAFEKERRRTLRRYGLTATDWERMIAEQNSRCAICRTDRPGGRGESWHVDHDDATGQVRGLLCHNCNVGIGHLHHDPAILKAAIAYLHRPPLAVAIVEHAPH